MFDWHEHNVGHIAAHGVAPEEVETAVRDPFRIRVSVYSTPTEVRRDAVGATEPGRLLSFVYTTRAGVTRVVTARDATEAEKRRYRQRDK